MKHVGQYRWVYHETPASNGYTSHHEAEETYVLTSGTVVRHVVCWRRAAFLLGWVRSSPAGSKDVQPAATGLMLYILSVDGQATLEKFGFRPVGVPSTSAP